MSQENVEIVRQPLRPHVRPSRTLDERLAYARAQFPDSDDSALLLVALRALRVAVSA